MKKVTHCKNEMRYKNAWLLVVPLPLAQNLNNASLSGKTSIEEYIKSLKSIWKEKWKFYIQG
jgi:hypothetical protein